MTDPALPANDPPPPDDEAKQMLVYIDETGAATHAGCGGDVYALTDNDKMASCDKCKLTVGVEAISVAPEPPEIEVKPSEETLQPFRDALARDTEKTPYYPPAGLITPAMPGGPEDRLWNGPRPTTEPEALPEPTWRDPQCIDRHLSGCGCTGDARAPI